MYTCVCVYIGVSDISVIYLYIEEKNRQNFKLLTLFIWSIWLVSSF